MSTRHPTPWPYWLEYLRTQRVPFVETGPLRDRVICDTERAGLAELAAGLRQLVDWRRAELQALLVRPGGVFHGARLRGQDLSNLGFARCSLRRADLSDCSLADCTFDGADLRDAGLRNADLRNAELRSADLSGCKLAGATLPWSSGLMAGVKLAGATGWMPADRDLRGAKLAGADLNNTDLSKTDLSNADLSNADLSNSDLRDADLSGAGLAAAALSGARLQGARGGRAAKVQVQPASALKVGSPVVVALAAARALRLREVAVVNIYANTNCAKRMEVRTGPSADGPWTPVAAFTSAQTPARQTFAAAPDAPALGGFVQVVVLDTYGGRAYVNEVALEGDAWGPAA